MKLAKEIEYQIRAFQMIPVDSFHIFLVHFSLYLAAVTTRTSRFAIVKESSTVRLLPTSQLS